ncbi:MAG TPA: hypothetical protein EYN67_06170 [Flavobacteriales bacterium]|nr:hypothetical protein [Flavobacteriales bacterium]
MKKLLLFIILLLFGCSIEPSPEDIRIQEYGDLYTTMNCWWSSQELIAPTIFWCAENLETELISGYVSLAISNDIDGEQFFSICGREIILNSGHDLHDNLIAAMTEHTYDCYEAYERRLGNEFDWIWDEPSSTLQLIWRPKDEVDKVMTIFVPPQEDSPRVIGSVYYKTGYFN